VPLKTLETHFYKKRPSQEGLFSGRRGIEIEHKEFTLVDFEEFSLQLTGLLDSIEAMQKSGENKTV